MSKTKWQFGDLSRTEKGNWRNAKIGSLVSGDSTSGRLASIAEELAEMLERVEQADRLRPLDLNDVTELLNKYRLHEPKEPMAFRRRKRIRLSWHTSDFHTTAPLALPSAD